MNARQPVLLAERGTRATVEGILRSDLTAADLTAAELAWGMLRRAGILRLKANGVPAELLPKHYGWDWRRKASHVGDPLHMLLGIECKGVMQGMIEIIRDGHIAKLQEQRGKPLIYVSYLEVAPWNLPRLTPPDQYSGVQYSGIGSALIAAAIEFSRDEGCQGRIGLHSLPGVEAGGPEWFYSTVCGMRAMEEERNYEGLLYFEHTAESATRFYRGRE